jgi:predicted dehydrogenase
VIGLADYDVRRAEAVAVRYGVERWFASGEELLEACEPDGVSVVTPGAQHLEITLRALERGTAVLLEKPVALSSADANAIAAAAQASAAFVMPGHILRFAAPYVELAARVREGAIGSVLAISSVRDRPRSHEVLYPDVHPAFMTMIHDIDLALWLSGSRAERVVASGLGARSLGGPPSVVWAHVQNAVGGVWSLRTSWLLSDETPTADRLEVYGSDGILMLELRPTVTLLGDRLEAIDHELTPVVEKGAIGAEVDHFCACLRTQTAPTRVTLADAQHGVEVAEAIVNSVATNGAAIDLAANTDAVS